MTLKHTFLAATLTFASVAALAADWTELSLKGHNSVWADPSGAYVLASSGRTFQISRDQGATWTQVVEPQAKGRHWNALGFQGDTAPGRVALFPIDSPIGWFTTDAGATWKTFAKPTPPAVKKHDGWTYGCIDWSQPSPTRFFGKEHHTANLWFSPDAGATWNLLAGVNGYYGIGFSPSGALLLATGEARSATSDEKRPSASRRPGKGPSGIYRSEDDGRTWKCVFEGAFPDKVSVAHHDRSLYWLTNDGMVVSSDDGLTWKPLSDAPADGRFGPYFGKTADEMLIVSGAGVHLTLDGGATWKLVLPKAEFPEPIRKAGLPGYAYDPVHRDLYATAMGVPLFRVRVP